jgi:hypothetical protein
MLQHVTIKTSNAQRLKPLVQSALEQKARLLQNSIQHTYRELKKYEERFGMTSAEFERKFRAKEIEETLDYLDWWMEIEGLHHLEEMEQSLKEARLA